MSFPGQHMASHFGQHCPGWGHLPAVNDNNPPGQRKQAVPPASGALGFQHMADRSGNGRPRPHHTVWVQPPGQWQHPATALSVGIHPPGQWQQRGPLASSGAGIQVGFGRSLPPDVQIRKASTASGNARARSRSPHRRRHHRQEFDMASIKSNLEALSPEEFAQVFFNLPREHRGVAYQAPPGVNVEAQKQHWESDSWAIVPIAKQTSRHFWDLLRLVPLATQDESKWKATVNFLKGCPEKPDPREGAARVLDFNTDLRARAVSPVRSPQPRALSSASSGKATLSAMAATPPTRGQVSSPSGREQASRDDFATLFARRVETDIANLSLASLEIDPSNRRSKKCTPAKALAAIGDTRAMSVEHQDVFKIYHRRFESLLEGVKITSRHAKPLKSLCNVLNLDVKEIDTALPVLLARSRALDMAKRLRTGRAESVEVLMRLAGSVWLQMLYARASRRSAFLLRQVGTDPWEKGWAELWRGPVLYWITHFLPGRYAQGPRIYVGEAVDMPRRASEYIIRILAPHGATQQPFFDIIRGGATDGLHLRANLCEWLLLPLRVAPFCAAARKFEERAWQKVVGSLNPPRIYALLNVKRSAPAACDRLVGRNRPCIRRHIKNSQISQQAEKRQANQAWKEPLKAVAAALAGHEFPNSGQVAKSAWKLSPAAWIYVVRRATTCEDGFRRQRALCMLRRIARVRKDLVAPVACIYCSIPWVGDLAGKRVIFDSIRNLLRRWRTAGIWIPLLRHATVRFHWVATPWLRTLLSSAASLPALLCEPIAPVCKCRELLFVCPTSPAVTIDGERHIAAPQGDVPWPLGLRPLSEWPASLTLPPKREDLLSHVRDMMRRLRNRCKLDDDGHLVETIAAESVDELWSFVEARSSNFPVTWEDVSAARYFLRDFYVQFFDHNPSRLGVFCRKLVYLKGRSALNFGPDQPAVDFTWSRADEGQAIKAMADIPQLLVDLQPARLSKASVFSWAGGQPFFLPKWKAPGLKWRLVINKSQTPCNTLHSVFCKAIDVALNHMPRELWSDYGSTGDLIRLCDRCNREVAATFHEVATHTQAEDMCDCFHHLPCDEIVGIWDSVSQYWAAKGVQHVTVPIRAGGGPGRLGKYSTPGSVSVRLLDVHVVLSHFVTTNFVAMCGFLGRELRGAPISDALSCAALRLFKWQREQQRRPMEVRDTVNFPGSCMKLVHFLGRNMLALDASFRDDVRLFCAWEASGPISNSLVKQWSSERLKRRFTTGTMLREESDPDVFTGLHTKWIRGQLHISPVFPDPGAAIVYQDKNCPCTKPWSSWGPPAQRTALVSGLLCRCWHQSNSDAARSSAIWEVMVTLILKAGFPRCVAQRAASKWACTWKPPGFSAAVPSNVIDVSAALETM
ncbi:unnamed protein product [Polarella glacialis]|uniref:Uncharacterized protein n=1 Tax=Polarella glacialis TaxID=89957 RepID=A0A813HFZ2_POLGL|nr:unnamed protein product [Polarella glacialis]